MVGFIAAVIVSAVTFLGTQVAAALSSVIGGLLRRVAGDSNTVPPACAGRGISGVADSGSAFECVR
jgi:hypothetical protein